MNTLKEPLYYIKLPKLGLNFMQPDGYIWRDKGGMLHSLHAVTDTKFMFTEREIKAIDERYWAFAVPVEGEEK